MDPDQVHIFFFYGDICLESIWINAAAYIRCTADNIFGRISVKGISLVIP